jgi:hypothetical protein
MPKKLAKKKVKPKPKQKQKQKQRQSQRTSVTVNINTKSKTKRKAPRATNGNTNRVLQQFAQPLITLPSNLINPPIIPQSGLIPSPLQTRRNDGEAVSMGQRLGQPVSMDERLRAGFPLQNRTDPYEQSLSGFSVGSDSLRNYDEPEKAYTASLSSGFTVGTNAPSLSSSSGFSVGTNTPLSSVGFPSDLSSLSSRASTPIVNTYYNLPTPPPVKIIGKKLIKLRVNQRPPPPRPPPPPPPIGGLSVEPTQQIGVPKAGNPSLFMLPQRRETTEFINRSLISDVKSDY